MTVVVAGEEDQARPADELDWAPVLAFLPWLRGADPDVGAFIEGEELEDGGWSMPYEALSERAQELVRTLRETGVVAPGIDWSRWLDGAGERFVRDRDGTETAQATLDECRLLLVAYVRGARFQEGALLELFRSGGVRTILTRVEQLVA